MLDKRGFINCPPGTQVSLDIYPGGVYNIQARGDVDGVISDDSTSICLEWTTTPPEDATGSCGDAYGPYTTEYVVSAGDGALAAAWYPTTASALSGDIDGYLVQYRPWDDQTGAWSAWTTETKSVSDREHTFTGLANGKYQVRVRARSDGDDGNPATTDVPRYGLFYEREVVLSSDKDGLPSPVTQAVVDPGAGRLTVDWDSPEAEGEPSIHAYTVRYRPAGTTDPWQEVKAYDHDLDPVCYLGKERCLNPLQVTLTGLVAGEGYEIGIKSHNANGASGWAAIGSTHRPN